MCVCSALIKLVSIMEVMSVWTSLYLFLTWVILVRWVPDKQVWVPYAIKPFTIEIHILLHWHYHFENRIDKYVVQTVFRFVYQVQHLVCDEHSENAKVLVCILLVNSLFIRYLAVLSNDLNSLVCIHLLESWIRWFQFCLWQSINRFLNVLKNTYVHTS